MRKALLSICAASVATAALAAGLTATPAMPHRALKGADFTAIPFAGNELSMKKAPAATAEEEEPADDLKTFDFSLAFDPYQVMSFGQNAIGKEVIQAAVISPELATYYAGATVKSINFYNPVNGDTEKNAIGNATIYMYDEIGGTELMSQTVKLTNVGSEAVQAVLDTPYTIEAGKSFVIGVGLTPLSANDYYIVVDGMPVDNPDGCWLGLKQGSKTDWDNYIEEVGDLCIGMTIEAPSLPENGMSIFLVSTNNTVLQDTPFTAAVYVTGETSTEISEFTVEYQVGEGEPESVTWRTEKPFGFHQGVGGQLQLVCSELGEQQLSFKVTKVNGEDNTYPTPGRSVTVNVADPNVGYPRTMYVEEGTGTWCMWCPAGMVFMETLKEEYPDVIRVAVHSNDQMQVTSASPLINMYQGFPGVWVNRALYITPTDPDTYQDFAQYYDEMSPVPALMEITELSIEPLSERQMTVKAKARFAVDTDNSDERYGIAFSITEDGMGPYAQTNGYAGGKYGTMGGWEKKGSAVPTVYEDVLRTYDGGLWGYADIFPTQIFAGTEYEYEGVISIANVTSYDFLLNAIIVDAETGEVCNAKQIGGVNSGVDGVAADAAQVVAEEYYDLNGLRVEKPAKGVYIKRTLLTDGTLRHAKVFVNE